MKIGKKQSSMQQMAYARRIFGGDGKVKKQIALDCGYAPSVANSVMSHIENKQGFKNAMAELASESNNLALTIMMEFKARGLQGFTNQELINSLKTISTAWEKFTNPKDPTSSNHHTGNKLRTVIMNRIENQTITTSELPNTSAPPVYIDVDNGVTTEPSGDLDLDLDF